MKPRTLIPILSILLFVFIFQTQTAAAGRRHGHSLLDVSIVSHRRGQLHEYQVNNGRNRKQKSYVAAKRNEPFSIQLTNRSSKPLGAMVRVDRQNVKTGHRKNLPLRKKLYVVPPHQSIMIDGWNRGPRAGRPFRFSSTDEYGRPSGKIAVAVYKNRKRQEYYQENSYYFTPTRYGQQRLSDHRGRHGSNRGGYRFNPTDKPVVKQVIRYENRRTLCRNDIIACSPRTRRPAYNKPRHQSPRYEQRHQPRYEQRYEPPRVTPSIPLPIPVPLPFPPFFNGF